MLAGVGDGAGDDTVGDETLDGVALGEELGDGVPDDELAEEPPTDVFAGVEAHAAARPAITTAQNMDRVLEPPPM